MPLPLKKLEAEALELPARERAELAHRLLISLDEDVTEDITAIEHAWAEAVQHRVNEIDASSVELIPAEQVFSHLRSRPRA